MYIRKYKSFSGILLNYNLRRGLEYDKEFVKGLEEELEVLESYNGFVIRTMLIEDKDILYSFLKEHRIGNIVTYKAFTSFSYDKLYNEKYNIVIKCFSTKGKLIEIDDVCLKESEVLYKTNSSFKVLDCYFENGIFVFMFEERY